MHPSIIKTHCLCFRVPYALCIGSSVIRKAQNQQKRVDAAQNELLTKLGFQNEAMQTQNRNKFPLPQTATKQLSVVNLIQILEREPQLEGQLSC